MRGVLVGPPSAPPIPGTCLSRGTGNSNKYAERGRIAGAFNVNTELERCAPRRTGASYSTECSVDVRGARRTVLGLRGLHRSRTSRSRKELDFDCSERTAVLCEGVHGRCVYVPSYMRQVRCVRSARRSYHSDTHHSRDTYSHTSEPSSLTHSPHGAQPAGPHVQHVAEYTHEQAVVPNGQLAADLPHTHAF
jgi:hypothetical protein